MKHSVLFLDVENAENKRIILSICPISQEAEVVN